MPTRGISALDDALDQLDSNGAAGGGTPFLIGGTATTL